MFGACGSPDTDAARAEILELQATERAAHMNGDAELLVSLFADDFVSVQDGRITHPTRAESLERFRSYFQRSTLLAWDDLTPPEIHLSADGSMAVVWVHKLVRTETTAEGGSAVRAETEFAWTETWERRNGAWRLTSVTSSARPAGS
jgi:hypothetical protein